MQLTNFFRPLFRPLIQGFVSTQSLPSALYDDLAFMNTGEYTSSPNAALQKLLDSIAAAVVASSQRLSDKDNRMPSQLTPANEIEFIVKDLTSKYSLKLSGETWNRMTETGASAKASVCCDQVADLNGKFEEILKASDEKEEQAGKRLQQDLLEQFTLVLSNPSTAGSWSLTQHTISTPKTQGTTTSNGFTTAHHEGDISNPHVQDRSGQLPSSRDDSRPDVAHKPAPRTTDSTDQDIVDSSNIIAEGEIHTSGNIKCYGSVADSANITSQAKVSSSGNVTSLGSVTGSGNINVDDSFFPPLWFERN